MGPRSTVLELLSEHEAKSKSKSDNNKKLFCWQAQAHSWAPLGLPSQPVMPRSRASRQQACQVTPSSSPSTRSAVPPHPTPPAPSEKRGLEEGTLPIPISPRFVSCAAFQFHHLQAEAGGRESLRGPPALLIRNSEYRRQAAARQVHRNKNTTPPRLPLRLSSQRLPPPSPSSPPRRPARQQRDRPSSVPARGDALLPPPLVPVPPPFSLSFLRPRCACMLLRRGVTGTRASSRIKVPSPSSGLPHVVGEFPSPIRWWVVALFAY